MKIPEQYLPVMPYLILQDADGFARFAKTVFDAKDQMRVPSDSGKVMHGELRIGDAVIMYADATPTWQGKTAAMYMHVPDVDAIFDKALLNGANELMGPGEKDYGYTAGFMDPYGNHWFIVQA